MYSVYTYTVNIVIICKFNQYPPHRMCRILDRFINIYMPADYIIIFIHTTYRLYV